MTARLCPVCGEESAAGLVCGRCTGRLRGDLRQVVPRSDDGGPAGLPWELGADMGLAGMLEQQLARQGQSGTGNGGRGSSSPVPFDAGARFALDALRAALAVTVLELGDGSGWPDDRGGEASQLVAMAEWIRERIPALRRRGDPAAALIGEIHRAVAIARSVVDRAAVREYVGACELCGGALFTRSRPDTAICQRCERVVDDAPARRRELLDDQVQSGLATRDDILDAAPSTYGQVIGNSTFASWVKRGRLVAKGSAPDGQPLYRVGDVIELAKARSERRARRR